MLVNIWQAIPDELKIFLVSMMPVFELRASIPMGILMYKMPIVEVLTISVIGNILVLIPIKIFLNFFVQKLMKMSKFINQVCNKVFDKTRKEHSKKIDLYGALALILIVAVPLPGTGGWTGALIAYVFDMPVKKSLPLISAGILIAGVLVSLMTIGVLRFSF